MVIRLQHVIPTKYEIVHIHRFEPLTVPPFTVNLSPLGVQFEPGESTPGDATLAEHVAAAVLTALAPQLNQIIGANTQMDARLIQILTDGAKDSANLDTIKTDVQELKAKEEALEAQLALTDPADSAKIDEIVTQRAEISGKISELLSGFTPITTES